MKRVMMLVAMVAVFGMLVGGCSTVRELGLSAEYDDVAMGLLIEGVRVAAVKNGLDADVLGDDEIREIVNILAAQERLDAIGLEKAKRADVQARANELIQKYLIEGALPGQEPEAAEPVEADGWPIRISEWFGVHGEGAVLDPDYVLALDGWHRWTEPPASYRRGAEGRALACVFAPDGAGGYYGGKAHWVQSGGLVSDIHENVANGYAQWRAIPSGTPVKVCAMSVDGRLRSNLVDMVWP